MRPRAEVDCTGRILVTGATGFVGHYALAALLRRGRRCAALVCRADDTTRDRLTVLLEGAGLPSGAYEPEQLLLAPGRLPDSLPDLRGLGLGAVLHVAGVTSFERAGDGEPFRTNTDGTRRLLDWCDAHSVRAFHLVSSAYVCGKRRGLVEERIEPEPPAFRNVYEQSKWQSEQLCAKWARKKGRSLTVLRPAVVAGDSTTGRATRFRGFYVVARAVELLSRSLANASPDQRHNVPLRLPGKASYANELVPVDVVAQAIGHVVTTPQLHGDVYHLIHPCPPTNGQIKLWLEQIFDVGGSRFAGDETPAENQRNQYERLFYDVMQNVATYFAHAPMFCRERARRVLDAAGISCPAIDGDFIRRLVAAAQAAQWGRALTRPVSAGSAGRNGYCAAYFERFLPEHVPQSRVGRIDAINAAVRFIIDGEPDGQWLCRFERGRVAEVRRGAKGMAEDFAYRTALDGFWEAISGRVTPEAMFLAQRADVFGDVEQALKMAAILHEFTREFPCDRQRLESYRARA